MEGTPRSDWTTEQRDPLGASGDEFVRSLACMAARPDARVGMPARQTASWMSGARYGTRNFSRRTGSLLDDGCLAQCSVFQRVEARCHLLGQRCNLPDEFERTVRVGVRERRRRWPDGWFHVAVLVKLPIDGWRPARRLIGRSGLPQSRKSRELSPQALVSLQRFFVEFSE